MLSRLLNTAFSLTLLASVSSVAASPRPPNQILIVVDDLGRDWVRAYGASHSTPNLDRLASEGVRFETVWCTPVCTPTRVALLTGQQPHRSGWTVHYDVPRWGGAGLVPERFPTLGVWMRKAGYATAIVGKWQINDLRTAPDLMQRHGFDEHALWTGVEAGNPASARRYWEAYLQIDGQRRTHEGEFGPAVLQRFAFDFIARHRERPFFLYYPLINVHAPNEPTPLNRETAPSGEDALYAGMVSYTDHQIGELLRHLETLGLRENTVIIFVGDNGSSTGGTLAGKAMPAAKGTRLSNLAVQVPLIVHGPSFVRAGAVSRRLTSVTDVLPTMIEFAGFSLPDNVPCDGRSFVAELKTGAPGEERTWLSTQYGKQRAVRDERYYVDNEGGFYDLLADPLQQHVLPLNASAEAPAAHRRLHAALESLPADSGPPFPEFAHAERLLREHQAAVRSGNSVSR